MYAILAIIQGIWKLMCFFIEYLLNINIHTIRFLEHHTGNDKGISVEMHR